MMESYLISIVGIVSLMMIWVAVQSFWRKTFSEHISDNDVLAERRSCSNCGCTTACESKKKTVIN